MLKLEYFFKELQEANGLAEIEVLCMKYSLVIEQISINRKGVIVRSNSGRWFLSHNIITSCD